MVSPYTNIADEDTVASPYIMPVSNPIESTFATVRLRTAKTRGCVSRQSMLAMVCMLAKSAERGWRKLKGAQRLAEVIAGVEFKDGMPEDAKKIAA
jgi:hypothetical protein